MKKILAFALALLMVFSLAACIGDGAGTGTSSETTAKTPADTSGDENTPTTPAVPGTQNTPDDGKGTGWPADIIAGYASAVGATIPELKAENVTYEEVLNTLYIYSTHIDKEDCRAWMAALAEQGFVRSLGLVSNSAFKVEGDKRFSVSAMGADESFVVTIFTETLQEGKFPYYQLVNSFGENFGIAVFNANGLFAGLSKDYTWTYDAASNTAVCHEAEDELEAYVRDLASSASDYYDEYSTPPKYVKNMFWLAIDETKTEGKQMECYVTRDGSTLSVQFVLADKVES